MPREFRLRDGRRVRVRPIKPEDRDRLQVGLTGRVFKAVAAGSPRRALPALRSVEPW